MQRLRSGPPNMTPISRSAPIVSVVAALLTALRVPAAAIPEEIVHRAVERGVAALKKFQAGDGSFAASGHGSGPTSLAALTLLECGVAPADEAVRKAAIVVRNDCPALNKVYHLGLAIMFLD